MKKTINSRNIDKEMSVGVASALLENLDGIPLEDSLSYLNGITAALVRLVKEIRESCELSDEDGLEKLILSWLSATDPVTGLKFSKFISTECIDIDLNDL
jgi:hypothetical protein